MFFIFLNRQRRPVLADSGCSFTCMSYEYFVNTPYLKKFFVPKYSCGRSINGRPVEAEGEVELKFRCGDVPMSMTCRVIKGLMDPIILGWDWMCKYKARLDAEAGKLHLPNGKSVEWGDG